MKGDAVLMLELKHIVKTYDLGEERVEALRAYGGARCLSARPGTLRVELGPRSALAWG